MPFKFFCVPVRNAADIEHEINTFLSSHRVLGIDRRWVDNGADSFWALCVDYLDGRSGSSPSKSGKSKGKDYREILSPDDFEIYATLRELRKEIAQVEAVPVYTIFTNEQLAQMVEQQAESKGDLSQIEGVGESRIENYGSRFLERLSEIRKQRDETGGKSV